jgi:hypothetical protein
MLLVAYDQHLAIAHRGTTPGTEGKGSTATESESIGGAASDGVGGRRVGS